VKLYAPFRTELLVELAGRNQLAALDKICGKAYLDD
jgi:hypothetical protein